MVLESSRCLICAAPNTSIHFGIDACRACASFFKRSTLSGRRLACRQGKRQCEVTRDDMFTCRRCRFDKCVAVGMVYDGPLRVNKKPAEQPKSPCPDPGLPSTSAVPSLLDRFGIEHEISVANRQEKELAMMRNSREAKPIPHPKYELYTGSADLVMASMSFTIDESWNFFNKVYTPLAELPYHEKIELFRFYFPTFTLIDSYFRTWKVWGTFDNFSMCSVSICVDIQSPDKWIRADEGGCNRNALVDSTSLYVRDQMATIVPSLKKASATEKEIFALFALALCETDMKLDASERMLALLDAIRNEVLEDLQRYYKEELGLEDYSTRLGNLMNICHAVRECNTHFQSFFRMQVTLFDMWQAETQLKDLLLD